MLGPLLNMDNKHFLIGLKFILAIHGVNSVAVDVYLQVPLKSVETMI